MALIPKFHLIPESFPIKALETVIMGQFVAYDAVANNGQVVRADGVVTANRVVGVSGDTKATGESGMPFVGGSNAAGFQNRVSDGFDETKASGQITVYHSGGTFASNQYVAGSYVVGDQLYVGTGANAGKLTKTDPGLAQVVAECKKVPGPYDSGVPGLDVNGSITMGDYIEFILKV